MSAELYRQAPVISLRMVKDSSVEISAVRKPSDIGDILVEKYGLLDREMMIVVHLNTRNEIVAIEPTNTGDLNSCSITMRELFKGAILSNAASIIVAHNHPSGDVSPSPEDVAVTVGIRQAGELLGIELLDHLVFSDTGWLSLRMRGLGFE